MFIVANLHNRNTFCKESKQAPSYYLPRIMTTDCSWVTGSNMQEVYEYIGGTLDSWYHIKYYFLCIPCNTKQKSVLIYMSLNNSSKMF